MIKEDPDGDAWGKILCLKIFSDNLFPVGQYPIGQYSKDTIYKCSFDKICFKAIDAYFVETRKAQSDFSKMKYDLWPHGGNLVNTWITESVQQLIGLIMVTSNIAYFV